MADLDNDGIDDALEQQIRVLAMAAAQSADHALRGVSVARARARERDEQTRRELQEHERAQHAARVAAFDVTRQDGWWREATPEQIGAAYGAARAWEQQMPEAAQARARIEDEMRVRHGVDFGAEVDAAIARDRAGVDQVEAAQHIAAANDADRASEVAAARDDGELAENRDSDRRREQGAAYEEWDSAARRRLLAADMDASGVPQAVRDARLTADLGQGSPASAATSQTRRTSRARATRLLSAQQTQETPQR